ncbi:hypothetical protein TrRE_jg696 [Triparma retinervis]|nr:hypothetical protein TrRE_jg696 [Triparma retinervis]
MEGEGAYDSEEEEESSDESSSESSSSSGSDDDDDDDSSGSDEEGGGDVENYYGEDNSVQAQPEVYYTENGDYYYYDPNTGEEKAAEVGDTRGEDELDRAVSCNPQEFSSEWESLFDCKGFQCRCELNPLMIEIKTHLNNANIVIIASGVLDGVMTLYCLGQKEGVRCYIEMKYNQGDNLLEIKFKSQVPELISTVVKTLNLKGLFGNVVEE